MNTPNERVQSLIDQALSLRTYHRFANVPYDLWPIYQQTHIRDTTDNLTDWLESLSFFDDESQLRVIEGLIHRDSTFGGVILNILETRGLNNIINIMPENVWNRIWVFSELTFPNESGLSFFIDHILSLELSSETLRTILSGLSNQQRLSLIIARLPFETIIGTNPSFYRDDRESTRNAILINSLWESLSPEERTGLRISISLSQQVGLFLVLNDTARGTFWTAAADGEEPAFQLRQLFDNASVLRQLALMEYISDEERLRLFIESDPISQATLLLVLRSSLQMGFMTKRYSFANYLDYDHIGQLYSLPPGSAVGKHEVIDLNFVNKLISSLEALLKLKLPADDEFSNEDYINEQIQSLQSLRDDFSNFHKINDLIRSIEGLYGVSISVKHDFFNEDLFNNLIKSLDSLHLTHLTIALAEMANRNILPPDPYGINANFGSLLDSGPISMESRMSDRTVRNNEATFQTAWEALRNRPDYTLQNIFEWLTTNRNTINHSNAQNIADLLLRVPDEDFGDLFNAMPINVTELLENNDQLTQAHLLVRLEDHPDRSQLLDGMDLADGIQLLSVMPRSHVFGELRRSLANSLLARSPTELRIKLSKESTEITFLIALPEGASATYWRNLTPERQQRLWDNDPARLFDVANDSQRRGFIMGMNPRDRAELLLNENVDIRRASSYIDIPALWRSLTVQETDPIILFQLLSRLTTNGHTFWNDLTGLEHGLFIQALAGRGAYLSRLSLLLKDLNPGQPDVGIKEIFKYVDEATFLQSISRENVNGSRFLTISDEPRSLSNREEAEVKRAKKELTDEGGRSLNQFWESFEELIERGKQDPEEYIRAMLQRVMDNVVTDTNDRQRVVVESLEDSARIVVDLFIASGENAINNGSEELSHLQGQDRVISSLVNTEHLRRFLQAFPQDYFDSERVPLLAHGISDLIEIHLKENSENEEGQNSIINEFARIYLNLLRRLPNQLSENTIANFRLPNSVLLRMYQLNENRTVFFNFFSQLTQIGDHRGQSVDTDIVQFLQSLEVDDQITIFANLSPRVREIYLLGAGHEASQNFFDRFLNSLTDDQALLLLNTLDQNVRRSDPSNRSIDIQVFGRLSIPTQRELLLTLASLPRPEMLNYVFPQLPIQRQQEIVLSLSPENQIIILFRLEESFLDRFLNDLNDLDQEQTNNFVGAILRANQEQDIFLNHFFPRLSPERQTAALLALEPADQAELLYALAPPHRDALLRHHNDGQILTLMERLPAEDQPHVFVWLSVANRRNFITSMFERGEPNGEFLRGLANLTESLSIEEHVRFIAYLPEQARARFIAVMPREFWQGLAILAVPLSTEERIHFIEGLPDEARERFIDAIPMAGQVEEFADITTNELRHSLFSLMNVRQQLALHNASNEPERTWIVENISIRGFAEILHSLPINSLVNLFVRSDTRREEILNLLNVDNRLRLLIALRSNSLHAELGRNVWQRMEPHQHLAILSSSNIDEESKKVLVSSLSENNKMILEEYAQQRSSIMKDLTHRQHALENLQSRINDLQELLPNNDSEQRPYLDLGGDINRELNNLIDHNSELENFPPTARLNSIENELFSHRFNYRFERIPLERDARIEITTYRDSLIGDIQRRVEQLRPNTASLQRDHIDLLNNIHRQMGIPENILNKLSNEKLLRSAVERAKESIEINHRIFENQLKELEQKIKNQQIQKTTESKMASASDTTQNKSNEVETAPRKAPIEADNDIAPGAAVEQVTRPTAAPQNLSSAPPEENTTQDTGHHIDTAPIEDRLEPSDSIAPEPSATAESTPVQDVDESTPVPNERQRRRLLDIFRLRGTSANTENTNDSRPHFFRRRPRNSSTTGSQVRHRRIFYAEVDHTPQYAAVFSSNGKFSSTVIQVSVQQPIKQNSLDLNVKTSQITPSVDQLSIAIKENKAYKKLVKKGLSIEFEHVQPNANEEKIHITKNSCIGYLSITPGAKEPEYFLFKDAVKGRCVPAVFMDIGRCGELKRKIDVLDKKKLFIEHSAFSFDVKYITEDRPNQKISSRSNSTRS